MIELTINGKNIRTEKGSTILEAALANGIKIPHLCYDKRLVPYGGCRMCVVEIEKQRKLEASCATLATEGMVVWTETPRVRKIRQTLLELILTYHPLDCPVCDKAGECSLQDLAHQYGRPNGRFKRERKHMPADVRGSLIELTANRCILCGKCVRVCAEHQGRGALGLIGRGFQTVVQPAFGEALECDYCGQCVDVCPTGAILSKTCKFNTRPWLLDEKETICPFCSCGCTLTLGIRDGKIVRSRGKEGKGVSDGNLCGRGRFGIDYIYSENRLKKPLIRKGGELIPVSWEEALSYISERMGNIIDTYGPSSVGAIGSPRCTNEENYVFQKFMRKAVGSDAIDSCAAFGYGLAEKAWNMAFGLDHHTISLNAPADKDVILVIESDLSSTHPIFGLNILKAKRTGSRLIVIDARETKLTKNASQWVKTKQGTSVALLNGIMNVMIDRGLFDYESASRITGFKALEGSLRDYTPEKVFEITGVSEGELLGLAETLAGAKTRMISLSISASENTKGLDTVLAAANLINLLGERPDALQIPAEYANTVGLHWMGVRPGADPLLQPSVLPSEIAGKGVLDMLYEPGPLKALYIMGADPVVTFPHSSKIIRGLASLDLLIVQDMALTETANFAHVILPASSWAEKDGHFINAEGIEQEVYRVVNPTGQSLPDWQIVRNLALIMGKDIGVKDKDQISQEIRSLCDRPQDTGSLTRAFNVATYIPGEETDSAYPLKMVVRDVVQHAGSMSSRSKSLDLVVSEAILEISGKDAEKLRIPDSSHVRVTSRRGMVYLKAAVSDKVPEGIVYVPPHFPHSGISALTHTSLNGGVALDAVKVEAL